ncbi:esterase/lipase family protein [Actinokineospora terrae]|uniref:Serine esterase n=1 Tax=Actinokineospora terrae TaxID=155974 RepID=A0A1H9X775_9PSEU|nr:hypothetical protein [Actinokineospora terrae]SES41503.1 hypothetical protein SAMN04487818_1134 [Actinokineospora terrae]
MPEQDQPVVEPFGFLAPLPKPIPTPAPEPDETWPLPGGTAWVYYGEGQRGLVRPVLLADGFNSGPSDLDELWDGLERGEFPFVSGVRQRGRTLVLIGYDERSESILRNAEAVTAAILRAGAEQIGDARLLVGGFSMGGLVTRYALAKLERQRVDHRVGVYLSYDSPHRGAWVPIALQNLAHFLTSVPALSEQINSPASRQLLWRHVESVGAEPRVDPLRAEFLAELDRVGGWPRIPRLLGVANGVGTGQGNGVPAGESALRVEGGWFTGTDLRTQSVGEADVARLKGVLNEHQITTSGLPELDGAPGGTLETFGIAGDKLKVTGKVTIAHRTVAFVPTVSAVAIADLDDPYTVVNDLAPERSELDDFLVAGRNDPHTKITAELGEWILDRLPD